MLESKSYLSNPNSAAATAARAQAVILDGINDILSGGLSTAATNAASTAENILSSVGGGQRELRAENLVWLSPTGDSS